jgi:hypothetical protein
MRAEDYVFEKRILYLEQVVEQLCENLKYEVATNIFGEPSLESYGDADD